MAKRTIFINDTEILIDEDASNFRDLLDLSEDDFKRLMAVVLKRVLHQDNPGEVLIKLIEEGMFAEVFYLAGKGLEHFSEDMVKRVQFAIIEK
jgi:hypothetical protein